jgi:hypothetical protein
MYYHSLLGEQRLLFNGGIFQIFKITLFNIASSAGPPDYHVSEDAGIELRTVETFALAISSSDQ